MASIRHIVVIAAGLCVIGAAQGIAADQPQMGPWNAGAVKTAEGYAIYVLDPATKKLVQSIALRRPLALPEPSTCTRRRS